MVQAQPLQNRNYGRWIEYFFSSSIMIVLISQITGISDIAALAAIFGINACMILFGACRKSMKNRANQAGYRSGLAALRASFRGSQSPYTSGHRG